MKKFLILFLCFLVWFPFPTSNAEDHITLAFLVYNTQDTFIASVVSQVENRANANHVQISVLNAEDDQNVQISQLLEQLAQGVDAVIINAVDRTSAIYLIDIAKRYQTPVVFINREPLYDDLCTYDKAFYVGTDPKELGTLCGNIVVQYFHTHPQADKNDDNMIQYVLLKGELGHQDTELRTLYTIKTIQDAGLQLQKLAEDDAQWERAKGQDDMIAFMNQYGGAIECVISNNDDMALGAIDALKTAGYFSHDRFMPVVGVDATQQALEALEKGTLLGTVLNDATEQGNAAFDLALRLAMDATLSDLPYELTQEKYIWVRSEAILSANAWD